MREENEKVEAIYVENGMIVDVGNKEELEDRYATVKLHYLEGKTMIPVSLIVICILLGMERGYFV